MRYAIMVGIAVLTLAWPGQSIDAEGPGNQRMWSLEGVLKTHPKFLYRYYLVIGPNQVCALYGPDHESNPILLSRLKEGSLVRVRGTLGTYHHPGSTAKNLSPFPPTWVLYMDVQEAKPTQAEAKKR